ncbi:uncharacterized protein ARMOST_21678 [Armillaria ostoyae]|uniref:Uncharacterized protein n=1 Tax=Armillaria ostoyae TaxID=47428 RepID=A0A284SAW6_ARMOS|nr:uncharacterized protein ARMOST_21678 [Armillaria ostoyae]
MSKDGTFDEAVKVVEAILHTASSVGVDVYEPQEWIAPAYLARGPMRPSMGFRLSAYLKSMIFIVPTIFLTSRARCSRSSLNS